MWREAVRATPASAGRAAEANRDPRPGRPRHVPPPAPGLAMAPAGDPPPSQCPRAHECCVCFGVCGTPDTLPAAGLLACAHRTGICSDCVSGIVARSLLEPGCPNRCPLCRAPFTTPPTATKPRDKAADAVARERLPRHQPDRVPARLPGADSRWGGVGPMGGAFGRASGRLPGRERAHAWRWRESLGRPNSGAGESGAASTLPSPALGTSAGRDTGGHASESTDSDDAESVGSCGSWESDSSEVLRRFGAHDRPSPGCAGWGVASDDDVPPQWDGGIVAERAVWTSVRSGRAPQARPRPRAAMLPSHLL